MGNQHNLQQINKKHQQERQRQESQLQVRQRQERQQQQHNIIFKIQTTKYLLNIANSLRSILHNMEFSASVMSSEEISREIELEQETTGVHYIFVCIGHMFHLPKKCKYYIYNLEQAHYYPDFPRICSSRDRREFINTAFKNAVTIFDYSKMNIANYPNTFKNKVVYLPIPLFEEKKSKVVSDIEKEYDVLFFGGMNDRRQKIMKYLKENIDINIHIVTSIFGEDLYDIIKKSRIVLNIHFKGESLLETARIHDCIRHSTPLIISEESIDKSTMEEYKDIVNFVPVIKEDLSNINELIEGIQNLLSNGDICYLRWKAERNMHDMIKKRFDYFSINIGTIKSQFKFWYNMINSDLDKTLKIDMKLNHRYKCFKSIPILRNRIINNFGSLDKENETILIEFRPFPHLEFLIRNTIIKLPKWNHTVVCGNKNYNLIVKICNSICRYIDSKITIIKLNIDNLTPSEYSKLLLTKEFWEKFSGEKLLVYQEDSMLFHNKIEPFLKFDYVGAPWPVNQDDNSYGVGNGGFSLRSKSKILKCIEKIKPEDLKLGKSTQDYMKNTKSTFVPEDVYFSKSMIDYNIGVVAPRDIAKEFSQETQLSKNPLGGHNYWLAKNNKLRASYINAYKLCNNYYKKVTHRSGWKALIQCCIDNNIILPFKKPDTKSTLLVDCMEDYFVWGQNAIIQEDWYGIIHYTNELPKILDNQNLNSVFKNIKHSIKYCKGIITLSSYLQKEVKKIIPNVPIYILKHPIEEILNKFSLSNFINKKTYNIIQLGLQYRRVSTIYRINSTYSKIWLSGSKDKKRLFNIVMKELNYLNIPTSVKLNKVTTKYTKTTEEFDDLLLNNIVIIPLWNASANNSVLECLEMNIPAFVTRLPATEEYLGKDYPMFFTDLPEIEKVINNRELLHQKYEETHEYLLKVDKSDIRYEHFNSELLKIINV